MIKNKKLFSAIILILIIGVMLTGCMPGNGSNSIDDPAGFFTGVWHGWIAPFSLFFGIFKKDVRVYEIFNKGWSYDFGFYIAIISGFGGISFSRKKNKDKD